VFDSVLFPFSLTNHCFCTWGAPQERLKVLTGFMKDVNENRLSKFELALGFTKVFFFFVYLWVSFALGHRQDFWLQRVSQRVLGLLPRLHPETLTSCTQKHILRIIDLLHNLLHRALFTHNRGSRSLLTLVRTSGSLTQPPP